MWDIQEKLSHQLQLNLFCNARSQISHFSDIEPSAGTICQEEMCLWSLNSVRTKKIQ